MTTRKEMLYMKIEQYKNEMKDIISVSDISKLFDGDNLAQVVLLVNEYFKSDESEYRNTIETFLLYYSIDIDEDQREFFIDKTITLVTFIKNL
jgi:hypothetical protein